MYFLDLFRLWQGFIWEICSLYWIIHFIIMLWKMLKFWMWIRLCSSFYHSLAQQMLGCWCTLCRERANQPRCRLSCTTASRSCPPFWEQWLCNSWDLCSTGHAHHKVLARSRTRVCRTPQWTSPWRTRLLPPWGCAGATSGSCSMRPCYGSVMAALWLCCGCSRRDSLDGDCVKAAVPAGREEAYV